MRRLLQYLYLMLMMVSIGLTMSSCHDDHKVIFVGNVSVVTTSRPLRVSFLSTDQVAYVKCTGKGWRASCASDWVELIETQGVDGDYIYFSIAENVSREKRVAVVRFYDIDDPNTLSDYVEIVQSGSSNAENALLTAEMERRHRLGYGYNIFGDFVSDSSFSKMPIFDYSFMLLQEQLGLQMITENLRHVEELEIISANTLTELSSKLTQKETLGGGFLGCGKTTTKTTEIFKEKTVDQECGMIRLKQIVTSRTIDLGAVKTVLRQTNRDSLYSKEFRNAIRMAKEQLESNREVVMRNIYQKFGSHLVLSADLGGEIRVNTVIARESSIESSHSVKKVATKIFGKKISESVSVFDSYAQNQNINSQVELTLTGGSETAQKPIKDKVVNFDIKNPITDEDIIRWQNSIQFPLGNDGSSGKYSASMVDCRLIPLYDIIYDQEVAEAYRQYLVSINAEQKAPSDEQTPAICPLGDMHPATSQSKETELYAQSIRVGDELRAVIGSEYVPAIRSDRPCLVAYPIVAGRPFMHAGVFVGDESHLPGMVRWLGNNCLYEPNEAFACDTLGYTNLLDEKGQLKNLYLYWGAVQMIPNEQVEVRATGSMTEAYMKVPDNTCTKSKLPVVKVGPHYWTRICLELKQNGKAMSRYVYHGSSYMSTGNDPDAWKNNSYAWASLLPSSSQAMSVMKFLNGRTSMMTDSYFAKVGLSYSEGGAAVFEGANMLGLNWAKGYWVKDAGGTAYPCDMNSWVVPTYEGSRLCITRLSMSGNATTMDYGDYVQSVGYLDGQFEKFIPFYFCTDEVH